MATTTLYLQSAAPAYTPATKRGGWDQAGSTEIYGLGAKSGDLGLPNVTSVATSTMLIARYVSAPLAADAYFTGTIDGVVGVRVSFTEAYLQLHVFVLQGQTDVLRGTILSQHRSANELTGSFGTGGEGFTHAETVLQALAGDTIVVEIGAYTVEAGDTAVYGACGLTDATDLTDGGDASAYPGWIRYETGTPPAAVRHNLMMMGVG